MKNTLFALTNAIIETRNIENVNSLESTKLVCKILHESLKGREVYLYGKTYVISGIACSGLDILVYIKDEKHKLVNYRNLNDLRLKDKILID